MPEPLTAAELGQYRKMRARYLRYGRRGFRGSGWDEYQILSSRVRCALDGLDGITGTIARLYWDGALSCIAISMRVYYSERHVRRLRDRAMGALAPQCVCDARERVKFQRNETGRTNTIPDS